VVGNKLLTERSVFLASPANLNDPFDASLPFRYDPSEMTPENIFKKLIEVGRRAYPDVTEEKLHERAFNEQRSGRFENDTYWKEVHEDTKQNLHKTFGLLSLTTKNDNLLMWAHYGNCHNGFCVGFDSDILFDTIGGTIGPVIYQEEFPVVSMFGDSGETMIRFLNTKSPHWSYEEEYRITKHSASNKAFEIRKEAITEVVFGCNMPADQQAEVVDLLETELPHVKVFSAQTSLEKFQLEIHPMTVFHKT
jgi:hypothetical protein